MAKKTETLPSSDCNCLNLRRAAQALTRVYDESVTGSSGISLNQFALLRNINELAPVSVSDLSAALRLDRTTLVRTLKPLEKLALIEDLAAAGTRSRELTLTRKGQETLAAANTGWVSAQNRLRAELGAAGIKQLTGLLSKIERL